ncbi:MAG: 2-amino-4-hydroxy-6-hydroxymethyldihydropteridine diphosphokinase, partial [Muribaculaceae bacterium]|nr:2-amino-4-hydroxy-6-hydroxymethyldihydropteridine diphosphokinase [Muribaculaceae bacterium]
MTDCILTLGSNCPARERMMAIAADWIASTFGVFESSGVYSTRALNGTSPDYLNMVVKVATSLSAERVIAIGKEFERCLILSISY